MSEKIIGYVLLVVGVLTILFSGINVYLVFKKQIQPIQFFSGDELQLPQSNNSDMPQLQIISPSMIADSSNLLLHFMLMGFFVSIGFRIGSLGVMLLRPIEVRVKEKIL